MERCPRIAQSHTNAISNWLHAVLHKIEGDQGNSRYWYVRSEGRQYEDYRAVNDELAEILAAES